MIYFVYVSNACQIVDTVTLTAVGTYLIFVLRTFHLRPLSVTHVANMVA